MVATGTALLSQLETRAKMDRPYQTRLFQDIRTAIGAGHKRILVVLPTGAGKGRCTARIMQMTSDKGNDSIFFAAQRELIRQIDKHLAGFGVPSQMVMAGVKNEYRSQSEFDEARLNTLIAKDTLWARAFRSKKMQLPTAKIVHIDECHQSLSKTYSAIQDAYSNSIIIGWTATPCRSDNKPLGALFTHMIQGASYAELQAGGWLVPVRAIAPDRPDLKGCKASRGDYQKADLEKRMNRDEMVGNIIAEWRKHSQGRSTVAFAAGIQHSVHIRNEFLKIGVTAEHIDGTMGDKERDDIIEECRNGKVKVLCNYGVATTGIDIPTWKYMICARPTKSFGLWRQMGGRIQRPQAGHDHCFVQDHSDNTLVFGFPDEDVEWEIDGDVDIAKKHKEKKAREPDENGEEKGDPHRCENCNTPYRGPHCPVCGHKRAKTGKDVKMTKGQLKELERQKANRQATPMDKQKFWDECLGWAIAKNVKVGAAAHRYKDRFGVFPNNTIQNVPRSSQWGMNGKQFYMDVVKPNKVSDKQQIENTLFD